MRTRVVTVNTDDSARIAVLRMLEEGVGSVAVCDSGRLVGIFTERDVLSSRATAPTSRLSRSAT